MIFEGEMILKPIALISVSQPKDFWEKDVWDTSLTS
jgi:hypothetical protein